MYRVPLFFWFNIFLEGRAEILEKISLVFWSKRWHQKDILKLTDLNRRVSSFLLLSVCNFGKFFTPSPLKNADVLNSMSITIFGPQSDVAPAGPVSIFDENNEKPTHKHENHPLCSNCQVSKPIIINLQNRSVTKDTVQTSASERISSEWN